MACGRGKIFKTSGAAMAPLLRALVALLSVPNCLSGQATLTGRIRVQDSSRTLAEVEVSLPGLDRRVTTGQDGRYEFREVPAGSVRILVRRIGYSPLDVVQKVPAAGRVTLDLQMTPRPVVLDSVVVTGEMERHRVRMAEFERRRQMGIGTFRTRAQLAEKESMSLSTMLRELGIAGESRRGPGSLSRGCQMGLIIDGLLRSWSEVREYAVRNIEALELYTGTARVPLVYESLNSPCGVLVLWTRTG